MNGEDPKKAENDIDNDDDDVVEDSDATVVLTEDDIDDDDGDSSAEVNVDKLVADFERLASNAATRKQLEARRRLDALVDDLREDDEFGSTYNFDVDDDLPT